MMQESETKKTGRILSQTFIILGWVLIVISGIVLFGTLQQPLYRDPSIDALLTHLGNSAIIGTIGVIIGFNFPSIFACLFGVLALVKKNPSGKILILASLIVFLVNSVILFLPSSKSASSVINHSIITTAPHSKFTVTFPRPAKKKVVTVAGIESSAYESEGTESTPYLRAEFMQGMHVAAIANDFQTILENHATLAGLSLPEITETDNNLGKVGTYSGTKKVGDYTVRIYGKMVICEWSAINCMVVENLETFPSEETVNFLASIKRK